MAVDGHPVFRLGLAHVFQSTPDLELWRECADSASALVQLRQRRPDVLLVDLCLPVSDGLELIRAARHLHPSLPIVVLSVHDADLFAELAVLSGANAYLMKSESAVRLVETIRRVHSEASRPARPLVATDRRRISRGLARLTPREMEIFMLIGSGVRTRDIAARLTISSKTVGAHREHIKGKLGLRDGGALTRAAVVWASGVGRLPGPPESPAGRVDAAHSAVSQPTG